MVVGAALIFGLWDKRDEFAAAFTRLSVVTLIAAVALQVLWLIARCEAWHRCVGAAGATVRRRRLFRAGAVGYLGNVFNPNFGVAVRIAALRRSAPAQSPKPSVLIAAEMPIIVIEIVLAALMSFTLIGPLGVPWYVPLAVLLFGGALFYAVTRFAGRSHAGMWTGLAVLKGLGSRNLIVGLVVAAVLMQAVRNFMILEGIGVEISFFDAIALLIATAAIGLLPVGPSLGATAAILILGSSGVAVVAAGGALLTATGAVGCIVFALWAGADRLRPSVRRESAVIAAAAAATSQA
ncbi:hypothetical protein HJD18_05905 [Thermoleophilia bacterium SCSIO 60948]|nr:hypothetical protein HJD18_05905 [Thermoleophilia bacterium SCSIO 60948]